MRRPARIAQLSSIHQENDVRVFQKECRSLAAAGFEVTLIAQASKDHTVDGVTVRGVQPRRRNRFYRMTRTVWDVFRLARAEQADAYHVHAIELLPAALALKVLGYRVIYDVHENFPKLIRSKHYLPEAVRGPIATATGLVEKLASMAFDGIVAATPSIATRFPARKTITIHNYAMAKEFVTVEAVPYGERKMHIAYIGALSEERGLFEMIDAIEIVNHSRPVRLVLGGPYQPVSLRAEAAKRPGWKHVDDLGWLAREEVVAVMKGSRVGLLILLPVPNHFDSNPNKLFEYMAAGLPMITSNFAYWNQFVSDIGSGVMVDPESPEAVAGAILWMLDHPDEAAAMGSRGRAAFEERFTWEREAERLVEFYRTRILT
jgi:glycosyltransferase involved in cell wall biosynthesis